MVSNADEAGNAALTFVQGRLPLQLKPLRRPLLKLLRRLTVAPMVSNSVQLGLR